MTSIERAIKQTAEAVLEKYLAKKLAKEAATEIANQSQQLVRDALIGQISGRVRAPKSEKLEQLIKSE